jgi:hypothetical protein
MCTASWRARDDGYDLFFNRDELLRRRPALPPALHERAGVRFIAPRDGDAGGSWIAANAFGVTLFLLNGFAGDDRAEPAGGFASRGSLVVDLADARSADDAGARLGSCRLERFRSFWLAALDPGGAGLLGRWAGGTLACEPLSPAALPLTSSSFDTDEVRRTRQARFAARVGPAAAIADHLAYHASHDPAAGPYSVCMHRPDAQTVSFSWVVVDRERVSFRYAPHAPHEGLPDGPGIVLRRNRSRSPDATRTS